MTTAQTSAAHTDPARTVLAAGEIAEYIYDAATDLGAGQAPENPTAELVNARTRAVIAGGAALDTPAIEGTRLFVRVGPVERGAAYELRLGFGHTNPRVPGERTVRIHEIIGV